jgi:chromosome segregation ATPase
MTDIVERLRRFPLTEHDVLEAADEIERLREENDQLKVRIGTYYAGNSDGGIVKRLEAEIARLREERRDHKEAMEDWRQRWRDSDTEAGRLRSELNMEVVRRRTTEDDLAVWQGAVQQRNAEIEQLRQLLRAAGVPEWVINPDENT